MKMRALLLACLIAAPVAAQDTTVATKPANDPSQSGALAQSGGQVTLSSTSDATDVRAEVGIERPDPKGRGTLLTSLRLQAPIQKGSDNTKFATLSGLTDGTVASFRVTKVSYGRRFDPNLIQSVCDAQNATIARPPLFPSPSCTAAGVRALLDVWKPGASEKENPEKKARVIRRFEEAVQRGANATCTAYSQSGGAYLGRDQNHRAVILTGDAMKNQIVAIPQATCAPGTLNDGSTGDADQQVRELLALVSDCATDATCWTKKLDENVDKEVKAFCQTVNSDPTSWGYLADCDTDALLALPNGKALARAANRAAHLAPMYYGFHADYKPDTFKFTDATTLEEHTERHDGFGVGATLGRLFLDPEWYVGATVGVERSFAAGAKPTQICQPLTGTATKCTTVVLKAPTEENHHLVQFEGRHYVSDRIAIMPRVTHDFHENHSSVELITFLFTDPKNGLNGGVDLGYAKGQPVLSVFVGTAFKLFGEK
jgi:hypothetical protein